MVASAVNTALILLIAAEHDSRLSFLGEEGYDFHSFSNVRDAIKTLQSIRYDLIILDDQVTAEKTPPTVAEIRRNFPTLPILVLTQDDDLTYQEHLAEAGVNDFLAPSATRHHIQHRINMMLRLHQQNEGLMQINRSLQAMASLVRLLYSAPDPGALLLQAVKLIRTTSRLYGVLVLLREGDVHRLFAGSEEATSRNKLYESIVRLQEFDPYIWTMHSRVSQIYEDIAKNPYYVRVPTLGEAKAVCIIPLIHQNEVIGAMGMYAPLGRAFSHEDLMIFEHYAAQVVAALQNARQHSEKAVNIRSSQHQIKAWRSLSGLQTPHHVARALCALVEEEQQIQNAYAWLNLDPTLPEVTVDAQDDHLVPLYDAVRKYGPVHEALRTLGDSSSPVIIDLEYSGDSRLSNLAEKMHIKRLVAVPIRSADHTWGGVLAATPDEMDTESEPVALLVNLALTAGQMMERLALTNAVQEHSNRLEAIIRSISEGIFFVDERSQVAFCNPQVTELTAIHASQIVNQEVQFFFRELAAATDDPNRAYMQLEAASQAVISNNYTEEDYPIVTLTITGIARGVNIEFVRLDDRRGQVVSWAGVVRPEAQEVKGAGRASALVNQVAEQIRLPYAQLASQIGMLTDQHGTLSYRDRDQLLRETQQRIDRLGQFWNNFLEIQKLESGGLNFNRENIALNDVVGRVLDGNRFRKVRDEVCLELGAGLPMVNADEYRVERALVDLLAKMTDLVAAPSAVTIRTAQTERGQIIAVEGRGVVLNVEQLERLFDPMNSAGNNGSVEANASDASLYIAREIIRRHGGYIRAERTASGAAFVMLFTTNQTPSGVTKILTTPPPARPPLPPTETVTPPTETDRKRATGTTAAVRAPMRPMQTILLVTGRSGLMETLVELLSDQEYELLVYERGEEAVRDVNMTHLDLILIDALGKEVPSADLCKQMRKRTEVPIILVADKATDTEKVAGLNAGADDFIIRPISNDELLVRVQVIFKRQHIQERTSEPLIFGNLYIDLARREVAVNDKPVELTRIEYNLLQVLVANRGQVLTHKQLLDRVWGPEYDGETHYLWVNISRLRKKLESQRDGVRYIHTQQGVGYYFDV